MGLSEMRKVYIIDNRKETYGELVRKILVKEDLKKDKAEPILIDGVGVKESGVIGLLEDRGYLVERVVVVRL